MTTSKIREEQQICTEQGARAITNEVEQEVNENPAVSQLCKDHCRCRSA